MGSNTRIDTTEYVCPCGGGTVSITQWDEERMYGSVRLTRGVVNCAPCAFKYEGKDGQREFVLTRRGDTTHPYDRNFERHIYPPRQGR